MSLRKVIQALRKRKCTREHGAEHDKWTCPEPCGKHTAIIPRHKEISPGVVGDTIKRMPCLPEGWLQ